MSASGKAKLVIGAVAAVLAVIVVVRFLGYRSKVPAKSIEEIQAEMGVPVDVALVERGTIEKRIRLLGNVRGYEQVHITSSLPIDITKILKREGEPVKKGEVVVMLARERIGNAYHQYALAKEALANAEKDLKRMKNLYQEGAVSRQMLEQATLAYRNARAQFNQARSMVDLISPIDGVVTMVGATEGEAAEPGVPIVTVARTDSVRVECLVGQDEAALLRVGQEADIVLSLRGQEGGTIEGRMTKVSLSADPESKLFPAEVTAANTGGFLKPGMVVEVEVVVSRKEGVTLVPLDALVKRGGEKVIYLVRKGRAVMVPVEIGIGNGETAEVKGAVSLGDSLVVRGQHKLADDIKVRIHSTAGPAAQPPASPRAPHS